MKIDKGELLSTAIMAGGLMVALCTAKTSGCREGSKKTIDMFSKQGWTLSNQDGSTIPFDSINIKWKLRNPFKKK